MEFMKLNRGTISLLVIVLLSSVLLFYFITFNGISKSLSINKIILREQQEQTFLKDFLIFAVELYVRNPKMKYPMSVSWNNFNGVISFDKKESELIVSLEDTNKITRQIEVNISEIAKNKFKLLNARRV